MPSKSLPPLPGVTPATICVPYSLHVRVWNWPVDPVMPWVTTLVLLLTRIDIARAPASGRGGRDGLARAVGHVAGGDDVQARIGEDLLPLLDVRSLHANDDGDGELHLLRRRDHAL